MGLETNKEHKLYIRLPVKIEDEFIIRDLHPAIIKVHLPRQKSRRWCIVDFENKKKLQEAASVIKSLKINKKSIKVKPFKRGQQKNKKVVVPSEVSTKSLLGLLKLKMGLDFIGNPYEQDELGDSDLELNGDDEWITFNNDLINLEGRDQNATNVFDPNNVIFDLGESSDDGSSRDDAWAGEFDDADDDDYDPADEEDDADDEDYEFQSEMEDVAANLFFVDSDFDDEDDDEECDYVTLPLNLPTLPVPDSTSETVKTTPEETNTNNPDNAESE